MYILFLLVNISESEPVSHFGPSARRYARGRPFFYPQIISMISLREQRFITGKEWQWEMPQ